MRSITRVETCEDPKEVFIPTTIGRCLFGGPPRKRRTQMTEQCSLDTYPRSDGSSPVLVRKLNLLPPPMEPASCKRGKTLMTFQTAKVKRAPPICQTLSHRLPTFACHRSDVRLFPTLGKGPTMSQGSSNLLHQLWAGTALQHFVTRQARRTSSWNSRNGQPQHGLQKYCMPSLRSVQPSGSVFAPPKLPRKMGKCGCMRTFEAVRSETGASGISAKPDVVRN